MSTPSTQKVRGKILPDGGCVTTAMRYHRGMTKSKLHPFEKWRTAAGIETKAEAAETLGMSPSQYTDILAGRSDPSVKRVRIAYYTSGRKIDVRAVVLWGLEA